MQRKTLWLKLAGGFLVAKAIPVLTATEAPSHYVTDATNSVSLWRAFSVIGSPWLGRIALKL